METGLRQVGNAVEESASQSWGSTSLSFTVPTRVYITAARSPARSEPANSQDLRPRQILRSARSAASFVRQMRPSSRKRAKPTRRFSMQSIALAVVREPGTLGAHPLLTRSSPYTPEAKPFVECFLGMLTRDLFATLPGFSATCALPSRKTSDS